MSEERYKFPTQLLLIFERLNIILWTSNLNKNLDYFIIIKAADLKNFFTYIKKSLQTSNSYIIEASSCDTSNYNYTPFDKKNSLCLTFYTIYFYLFKIKLTIFINELSISTESIDIIYPNCNWLEREFCEMYNLQRFNKLDSRRLLLNYCDTIAPLKKNTDSKGTYEVYYDFNDRQVQFINCIDVEL